MIQRISDVTSYLTSAPTSSAPLKAVLFWSLPGRMGPHRTGQHCSFLSQFWDWEPVETWTWATSRATLGKFFTFQSPRLTPGLEHTSDENLSSWAGSEPYKLPFSMEVFRTCCLWGSSMSFFQHRFPNWKEKRIQKQAELEKHHLLTAKDKWINLILFLIFHPDPS